MSGILDTADDKTRKSYPVLTGVLDYFPNALLAIAEVSRLGNEQHNPGQPLHWAKEKSTDHGNTAVRHLMQRGMRDSDGGRHTAKAAWRILAMLETEIEAEQRIAAAMQTQSPVGFHLDPDRMPWLARGSAPGAICPMEDPRVGEKDRRITPHNPDHIPGRRTGYRRRIEAPYPSGR